MVGFALTACSSGLEPPVASEQTYLATPPQLMAVLRTVAPTVQPNVYWTPYTVSASTERSLSLITHRLDTPNMQATTTFQFDETEMITTVMVSTAGLRGDLANSTNHVFLMSLGEHFRICRENCVP